MNEQLLSQNQYILLRALAIDVITKGMLYSEITLSGEESMSTLNEASEDIPLVIIRDVSSPLAPLTSSIGLDNFLIGTVLVKLSKETAEHLAKELYDSLEEDEVLIYADTVYGCRNITNPVLDSTRRQYYKLDLTRESFEVMPLKNLKYNSELLFGDVVFKSPTTHKSNL